MAPSRDLPPYRAVFVVDAMAFSDLGSRLQQEIARAVPDVLEAAAVRSGLQHVWTERRLPKGTGDGYIFATSPEKLPYLIDPYIDTLQDVLAERDGEFAGIDRNLRLRLRVSIHVGPLPDPDDTSDPITGIGAPMNEVHRLVEATELKQVLADSSADTTFVAAIISARAFEDAIESRFTGLHPDRFTQINASAKRYARQAYLYVPQATARTFRSLREAQPDSPSNEANGVPGRVPAVEISGSAMQNVVGSSINHNTLNSGGWRPGTAAIDSQDATR